MRFFLLELVILTGWTQSFPLTSRWRKMTTSTSTTLHSFAVSASTLEQGLSRDEQAVVRVVREFGPSVAYITSVLTTTSSNSSKNDNTLPPGNSLGSGSGFVVDASGYLCTNFHVIEAAYQVQQAQERREKMLQELQGNVSSLTGIDLKLLQKQHSDWLEFPSWRRRRRQRRESVSARVYVRINSLTKYQLCRIVGVSPELDVAVLKIEDDSGNTTRSDTSTDNKPMRFGSSSKLLVGQQLIAIGNPFGLDNTVTTGVVSALNREIRVGRNRMSLKAIRNCIQTDCAINPGNSGGPLLNRKGEVVGVNTAIVTTSGSSAGIGFAVPSDLVQPVVQAIVRKDKQNLRPMAFLGVQIMKFYGKGVDSKSKSSTLLGQKNWITEVQPNSPAASAGIRSLRVTEDGQVLYGDAIVAIGGNAVNTFSELQREMDRRVVGEQLQVTVEDELGNRRVVYIKATSNPYAGKGSSS